MSSVLAEKREMVAVVTLNRPAKLNALDYPTIDRLLGLFDELEADDALRAVILTGAGDRSVRALTSRASRRASGRARLRRR